MLKSMMVRRREDGFTLTEILVSLVIMGILMAIAVPAYMNQMSTGKETTVKMFITNTTVDLKQARVEASGSYPSRLPAEVNIPREVTDLSYTTSADRDAYCLAVTYDVRKKSKTIYTRGNEDGTTTQGNADCSFTAGDSNVVKLEGLVNTEGKALLVWDNIETGATYEIRQDGAVIGTVATNRWTSPASLEKETKYSITAILNGGVRSAPSNTVILQPLKSKPVISPALSLVEVTHTPSKATGVLSWTAVGWAEEYEIFDADTGASIWTGISRKMSVSAFVGESKNFYVVAKNNIGVSPQSNIVNLVGPLPGSPTLTSSYVTSGDQSAGRRLNYSWNRMPGAVKHNVYINDRLVQEGTTALTFSQLYPWNSGIYNVKVVPLNSINTPGTESNILIWNSAIAPPSQPVFTMALNGSNAQMAWTPVPAATKYVLEVKYSKNGSVSQQNISITDTPSKLVAMTSGQTIEARLQAHGLGGASSWSPWASVTHKMVAPKVTGSFTNQTFNGTVTCAPATTPQLQYRILSGSTTSAWSSWLNGANQRLALTSATPWNNSITLETRAKCVNTNESAESPIASNTFTSAVKRTPAPNTLSVTTQKQWIANGSGGGNMEFTTDLMVISGGACPAGTSIKTKLEVRNASGYLIRYENYTDQSTIRSTTLINDKSSGTVVWTSACATPNGVEGVQRVISERLTPTLDAPTNVQILKGYRKVDFTSTCLPGLDSEYKYDIKTTGVQASQDYDSFTTTGTQFTGRDWGTGTVNLWAVCVLPTGGSSAPSSMVQVKIP